MSGRPFPTFAADGDLDQYDGYDPTAHWDYLNASGFSEDSDQNPKASEQNPKAITYTLAQEVLLTGLAHTQVADSEAQRASLRSFFVNTIDAAGAVTRHPATGTFDADPTLTLTWETFDFAAAAATKTLQICLTEPPDNNGNDSNLLYLYEILLKVAVTGGFPRDTTPPTLARYGAGATVTYKVEAASDYQDGGVVTTDAGGPDPPTVTATLDGEAVAVTGLGNNRFAMEPRRLTTLGWRTLVYTATDHAGNSSTVSRSVWVRSGTAPGMVVVAPHFSTVGDLVGLRYEDGKLGGHLTELREQVVPTSVALDARQRSDIVNVIHPAIAAGSSLTEASTTSAHFPSGRDRFTLTLGLPPNEDIRSVVLEGDPDSYQASQGWKLMFTDSYGTPLGLKGAASGDVERLQKWDYASWKRVPSVYRDDWHVQGWRMDRDPRLEIVFAEPLYGTEIQIRWTKESQETDVHVHMSLRSIRFVRHTPGIFALPASVTQDVRERDNVANLIDGDPTTATGLTQASTTYGNVPSSGHFTLTLGSPGFPVDGVRLFGNPSDYQVAQGRRLRFADADGVALTLASVAGSVTASTSPPRPTGTSRAGRTTATRASRCASRHRWWATCASSGPRRARTRTRTCT